MALHALCHATGHYAGIGFDEHIGAGGRYYIKRADDIKKDQSYVLYGLTQEELSHTLLPLSGYSKEEIRELAKEAGLETAEKPDSQEICFIPGDDRVGFIRNYAERLLRELPKEEADGLRSAIYEGGAFTDIHGEVIGHHDGLVNFTIGQRKGLGTAFGQRMFVKELIPSENRVVLSDNEGLFSDRAYVGDMSFQALDMESLLRLSPEAEFSAFVKIRYADKGQMGRVSIKDGLCSIAFETPVRAVTPGQAAVLYDDEGRILAGGRILRDNNT